MMNSLADYLNKTIAGNNATGNYEITGLYESDEKLYKTIFDSAPNGICLTLTDGTIIEANNAFSDILGHDISGFEQNLIDFIHTSDLENDLLWLKKLLAGETVNQNFEKRLRHDKGHYIWVDISTNVIYDAFGKPVYLISEIIDISRKKTEEKKIKDHAALLDKARDAIIIICSADDRVLFWNKGAERVYGWTVNETINKNAVELLLSLEFSPIYSEAKKILIEKGEWVGELNQETRDRSKIVVESRWTLIRDDEGIPVSYLVINTDITDKKNLETQLLRIQRMDSIGTLISGIAHDLNNVFSPILLSTELLKRRNTDIQLTKIIETIHGSANRGAELIKQILSFSTGIEGERNPVHLKSVIAEIETIIHQTFPKSIQVYVNIPEDICLVSADTTQLNQLFMNLCLNARDAMPNGGKIEIMAENIYIDEQYQLKNISAKEGPYVLVRITDNGTGIPPAVLDRIFEPFFTTKELGKGTGIGLSTVLSLVKSHNGFINVYSEINRGTTFKVYFPAILEENVTEEQNFDKSYEYGNGSLVLLVDDEQDILDLTSELLKAYGFNVLTASDGIEALTLYAQHGSDIDIVITDIMMPYMDGAATIKALKKMNPFVKIIAVSGLASNIYKAETGYDDNVKFLQKPYSIEKLLYAIRYL